MLYNSADDAFSVGATVNAVIYSDGTVNYIPPGMFKSICIIRIDDFPFDEQICKLKFGRYMFVLAINLGSLLCRMSTEIITKADEGIEKFFAEFPQYSI